MEIYAASLRLLITFAAAILFGLERQRSHKPVGFGTFTFVSLGACALGVVVVFSNLVNPVGILSGVVTGIGFLGAGALIKGTDKVFGFTTAAAIWAFAIFGLTVGIGEFIIAFTLYGLIWVVVLIDKHLEQKNIGSYQKKLTLTSNDIGVEKEISKLLNMHSNKHKLIVADINKEKNEMTLVYLIEGHRDNLNRLIKELFKEPWTKSSKIE